MPLTSSAANYPLLVKVQTIDIHSLKVKANKTLEPRNVTCVEASKLFIFVGVTSGTVYAFSRETQSFKFMIPFKGGKVCSISCAENERDIAIGSIRGQVSLYQLIEQSNTHSKPIAHPTSTTFFKYIHTIEHHKGNEITELHWGSNGRYLFIGDSQGLVSQADVGTWEEFPRPVTLSQVILKLKNRIIQIQFFFPYLAICTVSAVVLCDIENEDFTRIQFESKQDIKATGLALILTDVESNLKSTVYLYVSEMTSGLLHRFNLQGQLMESMKIEMNSFLTRNPVSTFDPIVHEASPKKITDLTSYVTLGKLLLTDDNLLISVSNNHLYVIEPKKMELILWNDEFHKIQSAKLLSNYAFLLSTSKVHVLSLTRVLPYSEQLFRAGVVEAFERWIEHCLHAIGWQENEEDEEVEKIVGKHFRLLIRGQNDPWDDESEFFHFISARIPFSLKDSNDGTLSNGINLWKPFFLKGKPISKLLSAFGEISFEDTDHQHHWCQTLWTTMSTFYSGMNLNFVNSNTASKTLTDVMLTIENFHEEVNRVNLYDELRVISIEDQFENLEDVIFTFLTLQQNTKIQSQVGLVTSILSKAEDSRFLFFSSFSTQSIVTDWFTNLESIIELQADAFWADMLLLLIPLLSPQRRLEIVIKFRLPTTLPRFFTWLLTSTFCNVGQTFPHELQIKSLFNSNLPAFEHGRNIFVSIYREIIGDVRILCTSIHHVTSILFFVTDENDVEMLSVGKPFELSMKETMLYLLFSCFPLIHQPPNVNEHQLTTLCEESEALFRMFHAACLIFSPEITFCACDIPLNCSISCFTRCEILGYQMFELQEIMKKVILEILIQKYVKEKQGKKFMGQNLLTSVPYMFSMRTNQFDEFFARFYKHLSATILIELILRTGLCELLQYVELDSLNIFLEKLDYIVETGECWTCKDKLTFSQNFHFHSMDCLGIWILKKCQSLEAFELKIKEIRRLNISGTFSLRFYQYVAEESVGKIGTKGNLMRITCCSLHD